MKILVPVDGSPASLRAVKLAIELAAGLQQTTIVLLNVQNIPMPTLTDGSKKRKSARARRPSERLQELARRLAPDSQCGSRQVRQRR